jgi:hypothetical protein
VKVTRLDELKSQRDGRRSWLLELEEKAAAPNDGWPESWTKARLPEFRDICRRCDAEGLADAPPEIHEFDLFRLMLGDWIPASGARKTAAVVRKELSEIEGAIAMIERNERIRQGVEP